MPTISTTETEIEQEFRHIAIGILRDPQEPVRETLDDSKFAELVTSIKDVGLIEPLVVKDENEFFEVIAGHRRLMACRVAGLQTVPCMIRRDKRVSDLAIMIHENAFREDMNPMQEARFYARVLEEEAGQDVDRVCELVRRERNHVEGRLLLLLGHPQVVAALDDGKLSIAAARALNKLKNVGLLPQLLDTAMHQGATARQVTQWVAEADQLPMVDIQTSAAEDAAAAGAAGVNSSLPQCMFCLSQKHLHMMKMVWLHHTCSDMLDDMLNRTPQAPAA